MIVLNTEQTQWLTIFMTVNRSLYPEWAGVAPREIKNNLFILPENVLEDEKFAQVKQALGDRLSGITIRDVQPDEYINRDIIPDFPELSV